MGIGGDSGLALDLPTVMGTYICPARNLPGGGDVNREDVLRVGLAFLCLLVLVVACGDDDTPAATPTAPALPTRIPFPTSAPAPTATSVPTPRPGADSAPQATQTGDAGIDRIIAAVLAGDADAIESAFAFRLVPCTWATGLGGPPKCEYAPGQPPEGTSVRSLAVSGCEGSWTHNGAEAATAVAGLKPELFAVLRWHQPPSRGVDSYWPSPDSQVLFEWNTPSGRRASYMLGLEDGRIVLLGGGCGQPPEYELDRAPASGAYTVILRGPAYR